MKTQDGKFASTVRVGEKGQIVIPKAARDMFDIKPGDTLLLLADDKRLLLADDKRGIAIVRRDLFTDFMDNILRTMNTPVEPED